MEVKAKTKYLRISPKKMRLVARLMKNMDVEEALSQLDFIPKKASSFIKKTLSSAIKNAESNFDLEKDNLFIKEIFVNEGPTLKRWRPRAFGRAGQIRKRSSHLEIILDEKIPGKKIKKKKVELKEPEIKSISEISEIKEKPLEKEEKDQFRSPAKKIEKPIQPKGKKVFRNIFRRKSI